MGLSAPVHHDRVWLMDRNYHGAPRIAQLMTRTHVLIRLKSDIPLKRLSEILADGSYLAELSGDGVTGPCGSSSTGSPWRARTAGDVLPGHRSPGLARYPAPELAALYKWRWDGRRPRCGRPSIPGRRQPVCRPMLRSGSPALVRQELAAWAAGTE